MIQKTECQQLNLSGQYPLMVERIRIKNES